MAGGFAKASTCSASRPSARRRALATADTGMANGDEEKGERKGRLSPLAIKAALRHLRMVDTRR